MFKTLLLVAYLIAGAVIANQHNYFAHLEHWQGYLSLALAIVAWPAIVFFDVNLHLGHLPKVQIKTK